MIHEGQLTYKAEGFNKVLDFGEFWEKKSNGLPLPLGLDVVRKDLGEELAKKLSSGLKQSIHFGYTHQRESIPYALQWGRGINQQLGEKFVKMYVSELTVDMGEKGKIGAGASLQAWRRKRIYTRRAGNTAPVITIAHIFLPMNLFLICSEGFGRAFSLRRSLVIVENVAWIAEPALFGNVIDALIEKATSETAVSYVMPLLIWIGTFLLNSGRRRTSTRA